MDEIVVIVDTLEGPVEPVGGRTQEALQDEVDVLVFRNLTQQNEIPADPGSMNIASLSGSM